MINLELAHLAEIALRSSVTYLAILGLLRLGGKRELGQMSPFDLVVLLLLANTVQNGMIGSDTSLTGGLVGAAVIVSLNLVVNRFVLRSAWLERELMGSPTLLVHDGAMVPENLRRERVSEQEVMQALREHGVDNLTGVKTVVLEVDGTISVIPADAPSSRTRHRIAGRKIHQ